MYKDNRIIALIPARGGSKGLLGKNIKNFVGKPLIAWTIAVAKKSSYIDKIIVSTDSNKIGEIAVEYGAQVPFLRPKELATDEAKGIDVVAHAIEWLKINDKLYDILVLLQPTSPLRKREDIDRTVELLFEYNAQSIVSVCKCEHSPIHANILPQDLCMKDFLKTGWQGKNRQELPVFYRLNGGVYTAFSMCLMEKKSFLGDKTFAYVMPQERSIDIDNNIDFEFAEFLMTRMIKKNKGKGK